MPTGYTYAVSDGCTFEEFVWRCARGMGALVMMRDAPVDAPIPERFEPSVFYRDQLAKARKRVEMLERATPADVERMAAEERAEKAKMEAQYEAKKQEAEHRYRAMLMRVTDWAPPPEMDGFKSFMLDQLRQSLEFDCARYERETEKPLSGEAWLKAELAKALADVERYEKDWAEEQERTEKRNAWVAALRASVPPPRNPEGDPA